MYLVGKISTVFLQIVEYLLIKVLDLQNRVDIFGFQSWAKFFYKSAND